MKGNTKAKLHSIETFGAVDGPGIRTVFFLQGCPARCKYCHNPDTWEADGDRVTSITVEEMVSKAKRGRLYYGEKGGVTFSGGEPLIHGEFLIAAIRALREEGIGTAIDTGGTYFDHVTEKVIGEADLILLDVKHTEPEQFEKLTGRPMDALFNVIEAVNRTDTPVWVRQVIVPGLNDREEHVGSLARFIRAIDTVEKVELLGYHSMAKTKYERLSIPYPYEEKEDMDRDRLARLQELIEDLSREG